MMGGVKQSSGDFPQLISTSMFLNDEQKLGFKFDRLTNFWVTSSVAIAQRGLTIKGFKNYLDTIKKWNIKNHNVVIDSDFLPLLRRYQVTGVKRLMESKSLLLGDEMGLGKTIQCAVALSSLGESAIVVCPNHLVQNWMSELKKWTKNLALYDRTKIPKNTRWGKLSRGVVYVVPYSQIHKLDNANCGVLICDESHLLNSVESRRTIGVANIKATQKWFLSGTAFKNHPVELWSQIILLGMRDFFGHTKSGFALGFGLCEFVEAQKLRSKPKGVGFKRPKSSPRMIPAHLKPLNDIPEHSIALLEKGLKSFYLRRDKARHLNLPPKIRNFFRLGSTGRLEKNIAKQFGDLDLYEITTPNHISELSAMRVESSLKMIQSSDFKSYATKLIESQSIVFAYHNEVLDTLVEYFKNMGVPIYTIIRGDSPDQVTDAVEWFQNTDSGVLIVSIKKGSTGLTLTNAKRICFVELDWTTAELDQCESRVHRFGKHGNTLIDYLVPSGGVDDLVLEKLQFKELNNKILEEN